MATFTVLIGRSRREYLEVEVEAESAEAAEAQVQLTLDTIGDAYDELIAGKWDIALDAEPGEDIVDVAAKEEN